MRYDTILLACQLAGTTPQLRTHYLAKERLAQTRNVPSDTGRTLAIQVLGSRVITCEDDGRRLLVSSFLRCLVVAAVSLALGIQDALPEARLEV